MVFGQKEFGSTPSKIGLFDCKSKRVVWTSEELSDGIIFNGIQKLEYHDNHIYLLDLKK
jgi:hypothetical protein